MRLSCRADKPLFFFCRYIYTSFPLALVRMLYCRPYPRLLLFCFFTYSFATDTVEGTFFASLVCSRFCARWRASFSSGTALCNEVDDPLRERGFFVSDFTRVPCDFRQDIRRRVKRARKENQREGRQARFWRQRNKNQGQKEKHRSIAVQERRKAEGEKDSRMLQRRCGV